MINDILIYLWEVSVCLALSTVFFKVFFEKLSFFYWNRILLLGLLVLAALIPLLSFEMWPSEAGLTEIFLPEFLVGGQIEQEFTVSSPDFSWFEILFFAYAIGVFITIIRVIWGLRNLLIRIKTSTLKVFEGHQLLIHPSFEPASFFNYIMLSSFDSTDLDNQLILLHESVHCRQKHTWDLILVQLLKILLWFNPFIFIYERLVKEVHEFEADHFVTRFHSELTYSKLLLRLVTKNNTNDLVHSFNQFQTKKRILMMTQTNTKPIQKVRFILTLPLLILFISAFSYPNTKNLESEFLDNLVIPNPAESASDTTSMIINKATGKDGKEVYDLTEIQPSPAGGMDGWIKYLSESLQYPEEAKKQGIEGTVVLAFIINSDGTISDIETLRGIGGGCDEEAKRVIQNAPKWTPAQLGGKTVNCRMRLPIRFKMS